MSVAAWVAVSFVAGAAVGVLITVLARRGAGSDERERRLRREYEQYQGEVARHFSQTGELLSRLRGAFEQLYGEVEDRAAELVGEDALQRRLRDLETPWEVDPMARGPRSRAEGAPGDDSRAPAHEGREDGAGDGPDR